MSRSTPLTPMTPLRSRQLGRPAIRGISKASVVRILRVCAIDPLLRANTQTTTMAFGRYFGRLNCCENSCRRTESESKSSAGLESAGVLRVVSFQKGRYWSNAQRSAGRNPWSGVLLCSVMNAKGAWNMKGIRCINGQETC